MVKQERRDVFETSKKIQMIKEAASRKEQFDQAIAVADEDPMVENVPGTSADDGVTFMAGSGRINYFSLFSFIIFHFLAWQSTVHIGHKQATVQVAFNYTVLKRPLKN